MLLPLIAFFIGIVASMVGIGGGVFMVPTLVLLYGFSPNDASGTSLAIIIFTSSSSSLRYRKQRRIDYALGILLTATTIPGALMGAYLTSVIPRRTLGLIFSIFLVFVAARMLLGDIQEKSVKATVKGWKREVIDSEGKKFIYETRTWFIPLFGFLGGFFSGLLGIGGGAVLVPAMHLAMNVPMHIAVATSMFTMIFTSTSGTITHLLFKHVHLEYVLLAALSVILGAQVGAHTAKGVSAKRLRRIFGVVLILISIRMLLKYTALIS